CSRSLRLATTASPPPPLHDALPIFSRAPVDPRSEALIRGIGWNKTLRPDFGAGLYRGQPMGIPYVVVSGSQKRVPIRLAAYADRSEEHTSELQSRENLVCRLLLDTK